ncbi:MAG: recombination protein RecR [Candidatus Wildermuthbacteria bacterium RIFCSPLOWO2_12_FULL_40_9]|uniref:Recombination protein RecR n=2 Tax=Candidatus Wildermuthiibacteriota TaxID=1817923 RepID=A0A1G2RFD4_9BACT|nr:MAG: recombination protein RecR [Candidatus Wildermuthbacteria bacterium RIFCSPHIGHO2_12_FULL_40_12]OHA76087.1 MAG: recombination protein RecR [Candidatus Wildermuthbacteria bacterium RIFCSPLOWO2_12_FULL_40_9]
MFSPTIQKLIDLFAKFPTVGPRTAARFVFYLLKLPGEEAEKIISAISNLKEKVKTCHSCFNSFEGEGKLCVICKDSNRDKSLLCVVEKESDLASIEKIKKYNGLYFILGETVSTLKKSDLLKLRTKELEERIKEQKNIQEIIIAINPTAEGETIALYLEKLLKKALPEGKRVTRLGRGLPLGGEIEYADEETISSAFEGRR